MPLMEATIRRILEDNQQVTREAVQRQMAQLEAAADMLSTSLAGGHKILLFGNGGSAAQAQHLAAELVGRFQAARHALPALALSVDTSILTSVSNDFGFEAVFARQIEALGQPDDVAWALTTSGDSANVIAGLTAARHLGLHCLGLTGRAGRVAQLADIALTVDSPLTARVQEAHITMGHILCELLERTLFPAQAPGA